MIVSAVGGGGGGGSGDVVGPGSATDGEFALFDGATGKLLKDGSGEAAKLAGIETSADVTDATNVAAAGAVMDSDISEGEGMVRKTGAGAYEAIKTNLAASVAPDANDDTGDGYVVGSTWIDTTADKAYVCLDATSTAAVWKETTQSAGATAVTAASVITDTAVVVGDGGARGAKTTAVLIDGSNNMSGIGTLDGSGAVTFGANTDIKCTFGRLVLSAITADRATLAHFDRHITVNEHGWQQTAAGSTTLNCRSGQSTQLQHGGGGTIRIRVDTTGIGFFGVAAIAKPTVTGSRAGNAALASLLTHLASYGLIVDSSS
jgi:hypothetical protein